MKHPSFHLNHILAILLCLLAAGPAGAFTLTNPIVFVTQPPITRELNGSTSNTFLTVVTEFGNQQADTAHAGRGGDLWLMTTNLGLVNLTRKAGLGMAGNQAGAGIDVRDPAIYWDGSKVVFSMVVGAPTNATDATTYYWQMYELSNLAAVMANTNTPPVIVPVAHQPTNCNNVNPTYATGGRIIFMSDRAFANQPALYPQLDEYKGAACVTGTYSLDPVAGDLKLLEHLPSGGFNPFIDSFGRLLITRWDHLIQDGNATGDRLGRTTNGALNFLSEATNAATQFTNTVETFPEPNDFDTNYCTQLGVNPDLFNFFFPWALDPDGGNEEVLNHVGRHEISFTTLTPSFTGDTNLFNVSNLVSRAASGVISSNVNASQAFFQITEDPRTNGLYWAVNPPDISIFGGSHAAGQILTLTGGPSVNPTNMIVNFVTVTNVPGRIVSPQGVYRNPLPMSDGRVIAAYTPANVSLNFGVDINTGTVSLPVAAYQFRLMTLTNTTPFWTTNQFLTGGILNTSIYWSGGILVTNAGAFWELQPVEVRARPVPNPVHTPVNPIEQQVFADEGVDLTTFQADLTARGVALVVSRNITARDDADKQQPYNLSVPGGVSSIANGGKVYGVTHLQYLEADYLRGYTFGSTNIQPGRRVLAVPLHATTNLNYASGLNNAPPGGTQIMSDGSQATFVPAGRAVTWQLTGTNNNDSVVKERYWLNFRAGEVRTCANCHGINAIDQLGRPAPTNAPLALRQLLRLWRTNAANAYSLTVSNGSGGGSYGAGSVLTLTAGGAPSGKVFGGWTGAGISNATAATTLFIMPTGNASVTAMFTNLPAPVFNPSGIVRTGSGWIFSAQAMGSQPWILQCSSNLANWQDTATNLSAGNGQLWFTNLSGNAPQAFYRIRSQ